MHTKPKEQARSLREAMLGFLFLSHVEGDVKSRIMRCTFLQFKSVNDYPMKGSRENWESRIRESLKITKNESFILFNKPLFSA